MDGLTNFNQNPLETQVRQAQQVSQQLSQDDRKKSKSKKWIFLLIILAIGALGAYLIFKAFTGEGEVEPTPTSEEESIIRTPSEASTPQPEEEVSRAKVSIEILNGTGIAGEAKLLQTKLEAKGYSNIKAGNASSSDNKVTTATFSETLSKTVIDEIKEILEDTYTDVETKTSKNISGVQIITGLRSGQTLKPTASPAASSSPKATASPTPTPTN